MSLLVTGTSNTTAVGYSLLKQETSIPDCLKHPFLPTK
jgi:hypothetical protein